ncbi:unnamed protein product [Linum trigynum]|uniref:Uncharacterized protein n=1 Tax=Linum trigynum TaxID=586398 RepID=A0AAV2GRB7_9ROSI
MLRCHRLIGHIDGTIPPTTTTANNQPNPTYARWYEDDQLVLVWINLSLTEAIIPTVVNKTIALIAWDAPATVYRPFTRNLEARLEPISFENVSRLLSEEMQPQ